MRSVTRTRRLSSSTSWILKEAEQGIYAHVATASGLGKPGQTRCRRDRRRGEVGKCRPSGRGPGRSVGLRRSDLVPEDDGGAKGICTVAALMLCNACLLQRRLRDEPEMRTIVRLDKVAGASNPREVLGDRMGSHPREGLRSRIQTRAPGSSRRCRMDA